MGSKNASDVILEVKQTISNGQTMNYTVSLDTFVAGEKRIVEGSVGGPGVSVNFYHLSSNWVVTLKAPQVVTVRYFY